jgi:hypothetical protein
MSATGSSRVFRIYVEGYTQIGKRISVTYCAGPRGKEDEGLAFLSLAGDTACTGCSGPYWRISRGEGSVWARPEVLWGEVRLAIRRKMFPTAG